MQPDGRFLIGETAQLKDLFCACGINSIGILSSGGVGWALAARIKERKAPFKLIAVDVHRMQPLQVISQYLYHRTRESLGLNFSMHWPNLPMTTARHLT